MIDDEDQHVVTAGAIVTVTVCLTRKTMDSMMTGVDHLDLDEDGEDKEEMDVIDTDEANEVKEGQGEDKAAAVNADQDQADKEADDEETKKKVPVWKKQEKKKKSGGGGGGQKSNKKQKQAKKAKPASGDTNQGDNTNQVLKHLQHAYRQQSSSWQRSVFSS